jgi:hypothetical protein
MKIFTRLIVTIVALSVAAAKLFLPNANVDINTTILILIAALPWLSDLIDTAEFPGGWKFKFRNLKEIAAKAQEIGLASEPLSKQDEKKYSFQLVGIEEPNLALAGLRIELEKRLKTLAERNNISTNMKGLGTLINDLSRKGLLSDQERSIMADLTGTLNSAVHAARIDQQSAQLAMDFGLKILKNLDERLLPKSRRSPVKATKKSSR